MVAFVESPAQHSVNSRFLVLACILCSLSGCSRPLDAERSRTTHTSMDSVISACATLALDCKNGGELSSIKLPSALVTDNRFVGWAGPYILGASVVSGEVVIRDAWGTPLNTFFAGMTIQCTSAGPDAKFGTLDDILKSVPVGSEYSSVGVRGD